MIVRSRAELEYKSIALSSSEVIWLKSLLRELEVKESHVPVLFNDTLSGKHLSANPILHARMKHIKIDFHFIYDLVQTK